MEFSVQMQELLNEYNDDIQKAVKKAAKESATEAVKKLRAVSFEENKKGYSKGWTSKKADDRAYVVYNNKLPGLTHLLENGHISRNQYGEYDRVSAIKHIEPVEKEANEEFVRKVEEQL